MPDSSLHIAVVILVILGMLLTLLTVLKLADPLIFFAQLVFVTATSAAVWGAFFDHPATDYAVWTMYGAGIALAALMVWRSLPKKAAPTEFKDSEIV